MEQVPAPLHPFSSFSLKHLLVFISGMLGLSGAVSLPSRNLSPFPSLFKHPPQHRFSSVTSPAFMCRAGEDATHRLLLEDLQFFEYFLLPVRGRKKKLLSCCCLVILKMPCNVASPLVGATELEHSAPHLFLMCLSRQRNQMSLGMAVKSALSTPPTQDMQHVRRRFQKQGSLLGSMREQSRPLVLSTGPCLNAGSDGKMQ